MLCIDCKIRPQYRGQNKRVQRCRECLDKYNANRTKRSVDHNADGWDSYDFRDSAEFKDYAKRIGKLIAQKGALTVREIHTHLGSHYQHWTMDALESVDDLEHVGLLPTRYRIFTRSEARQTLNFKDAFQIARRK